MTVFFTSFIRTLMVQLHPRMLLLTLLPLIVALGLWGVALWLGLQPLIDQLQAWFSDYGLFRWTGDMLDAMGLSSLRTLLVPLIAMWLLLPLMIISALLLVNWMAMPAIARHVSQRFYPQLERRHGGSVATSLKLSFSSFVLYLFAWLVVLPLNLVPLFAVIVQPLLWGWLTSRVMSYEALSSFADETELSLIRNKHQLTLLIIGVVSGGLGAIPGLLWLGGAVSVIFFPILAAAAIGLYLLIFVFSGLWFQFFCFDVLASLRSSLLVDIHPSDIIDMSIT
jgi:hypothetical protein